jgi:hypothetical protein
MNAELIHLQLSPSERLKRLNDMARRQLGILTEQASKAFLPHQP